MSTSPFGAPGFAFSAFDPAQFERFMRPFLGAAAPAPAATDPFAWWKPAAPPPAPGFDPTALASQWMGQIQQLAAQFGGADAQAADIARAWRGLIGDNPFGQTAAMGAFMPSAFFTGAATGRAPFDMPAFGYTREHQERAQSFARTTADFKQSAEAFGALVAESGQDAFKRFESLLEARASEGKPVESARGLFDLWIDAAEDAYADIALTERFQKAFGEYVNAQMRVRAAMQKEVELTAAQWGMPGRSEVDGAYRRIAELEREVRRLREAVESALASRPAEAAAPIPPAAPKPVAKPVPRAAAKSTAKKTGKR